MKRLVLPFIILLLLLATPDAAASQPSALSPQHFVVSSDGPYTTIAAALVEAQTDDVIEVQGGVHPAPLVVDKAVTLVDVDRYAFAVTDRKIIQRLRHELAPE